MQKSSEAILATLPGQSHDERTQVVLKQEHHASCVEIRQQSWGAGVGWFTQSKVCLDSDQIAGLRVALGIGASKRVPNFVTHPDHEPNVLRFESA